MAPTGDPSASSASSADIHWRVSLYYLPVLESTAGAAPHFGLGPACTSGDGNPVAEARCESLRSRGIPLRLIAPRSARLNAARTADGAMGRPSSAS